MAANLHHGFEQGRADPRKIERSLKALQARLRSLPAGRENAEMAGVVSEALAALGRARGAPGYNKLTEGDQR